MDARSRSRAVQPQWDKRAATSAQAEAAHSKHHASLSYSHQRCAATSATGQRFLCFESRNN